MRPPKEKVRPELWSLQCLCDRGIRGKQERRLRISAQRKRSWVYGVLGVK